MKRKLSGDADFEQEIIDQGGQHRVGLRGVRLLVLDEADRMLDMGFIPQVREIVGLLGTERQTLMFSATWPPAVQHLSKSLLSQPLRLSLDQGEEEGLFANRSVRQRVEIVRERTKEARLLEILAEEERCAPGVAKTIIFCNTKKGCAIIAERVAAAGYRCGAMHGNLTQEERQMALRAFTAGETRHLVATDLAARGLDVEDISLVVCYDFPDSLAAGVEDYVHRIGRTGRAGREGTAVTFFPAPEDVSGTRSAGNAHELVKILEAAGQPVTDELRRLDTGGPQLSAVQKRKGAKAPKPAAAPPPKRARGPAVRLEGPDRPAGEVPALPHFRDAPFREPLLQEMERRFAAPTPVQMHGWPLFLSGRDCVAVAKTGSGKTLAFLLPVLDMIWRWEREAGYGRSRGCGPLALVVAPTRELAQQINAEAEQYAQAVECRCLCLCGGLPWEPQAATFEAGCELVVATPGRLAFLMSRGGEAAAAAASSIAAFGAQKQLQKAKDAFIAFVTTGGCPSRRLYSTYLNAHVLAGDLLGARALMVEMKDAGFRPGVVEYTTLLKGYVEAGELRTGEGVVAEMLVQDPPVLPDRRTANTLLRGCMKLGEIEAANKVYGRLSEWGVTPDAATYKYLVHVLGQGLRLKAIKEVLRELRVASSSAAEALEGLDNRITLHLRLAEVACLLEKRAVCEKALMRAEAALSDEQHSGLFEGVRRETLAGDVTAIRKALDDGRALDVTAGLGRTFVFPASRGSAEAAEAAAADGAEEEVEAEESVASAVLDGLLQHFGLDECVRRGLTTEEACAKRLRRCFGKDRFLRWQKVFATADGRPTKLEVCSGTGDWAVAQACAEAETANWVACELRADRVAGILTKIVLGRLENLALLAGDAAQILRRRIAPGSLACVCINFPEPPQTSRNASCDAGVENRLHLLTADFFRDVHAALDERGFLTILSDNENYVEALARTIGQLKLFVSMSSGGGKRVEGAAARQIVVSQGLPGPKQGHAVKAASYFDRFFQHGGLQDRYFLCVRKARAAVVMDEA